VNAAATALMNGNGIATHVIALEGIPGSLDAIAQAGGTKAATYANGAGAAEHIAATLRGYASPSLIPSCTVQIPAVPDPAKMVESDNAMITLYYPDGTREKIPRVNSDTDCGGPNGGYYFDNYQKPTQITLCPCSCINLMNARLDMWFSCRPRPIVS
jgi:hypothetical protein